MLVTREHIPAIRARRMKAISQVAASQRDPERFLMVGTAARVFGRDASGDELFTGLGAADISDRGPAAVLGVGKSKPMRNDREALFLLKHIELNMAVPKSDIGRGIHGRVMRFVRAKVMQMQGGYRQAPARGRGYEGSR